MNKKTHNTHKIKSAAHKLIQASYHLDKAGFKRHSGLALKIAIDLVLKDSVPFSPSEKEDIEWIEENLPIKNTRTLSGEPLNQPSNEDRDKVKRIIEFLENFPEQADSKEEVSKFKKLIDKLRLVIEQNFR